VLDRKRGLGDILKKKNEGTDVRTYSGGFLKIGLGDGEELYRATLSQQRPLGHTFL
jgi:hypothetical protein